MHTYSVLLPLKLDWIPVYRSSEPLRVGQRVAVMCNRKEYVGVVLGSSELDPINCNFNIQKVKDTNLGLSDINEYELKFWRFIADYYLCTLGEVYLAAYPKYKIKSEKSLNALVVTSPQTSQNAQIAKQKNGKPLLYRSKNRLPYYISRLKECLEQGSSALFLLPENEYYADMMEALKNAFPDPNQIFFFNTATAAKRRKLSENLRLNKKPFVVIGGRSMLFLPFTNLGLIIVDQEQSALYKQTEPTPRYNARDLSVVLASIHGADVVLGSYTPSLESLYNCKLGKYDLIEEDVDTKCKVEIVDIQVEKRKRGMEGPFSKFFLKKLERYNRIIESDNKSIEGQNKANVGHNKGLNNLKLSVIRSFCTEEEVKQFFDEKYPELDPQILTANYGKKLSDTSDLMLILNADSLFDKEDFRSDEKAIQSLRELMLHTKELIIQCNNMQHPVYQALKDGISGSIKNRSYEDVLLEERREFNMPPYKRLVYVRDKKTLQVVETIYLDRDAATLSKKKEEIRSRYGAAYIIDVDPI